MTESNTAEAIQPDIVVVGAGMAGLYFAWRMLRHKPTTKIVILEMLDRPGGRLDTDLVVIDGTLVKNEEGGMRFVDSMKNLMWLLKTLALDKDIMPFNMGDDNNIYYLRGRRFTFGAMATDPDLWSTRYFLRDQEKQRQPNKILQEIFDTVLTQNGVDPKKWYPQTPEDWQKVRLEFSYRGLPLYKWGFWALLVDFGLSQECLQMIEDSMGFLAFYDQKVNAGVGFQTMGDFDKLPNYLTLRPGYETLSDTLAQQIKEMGGRILLGHYVDAFDFDVTDKNLLNVRAHTDNGWTTRFLCPQLVLALPSRPLELLSSQCPALRDNGQLMADIRSVTTMPLTKINLYFKERWWFDRYKIAAGGSFTDLPMAQFYCYWPIAANDDKGPASMTIYCDFDRTTYWEELQKLGKPFAPTDGLTQPKHTTPAGTFVVEQAMRQLAEFFGDNALPDPLLSTYVRWGSPEFGDGDHSWVIGADDKAIAARLQNPIKGKVYICGEAYSDEQAWVDGALRSTETVLQECFGLPAYDRPV
ncbi:FAD-dependent oxidoreductase [Variovorax sp. LjRoot290]|uniref:flavin monoamine oxidase family protein n=1 Tax=unclassified Variovorax TaxID=663243 RepID=UPI003ED05641